MKNIRFLKLFLLMALCWSCQRNMDTEGPNLVDLYGKFAVLEPFDVSAREVDFSAGSDVYFTARFSKIVDWKITIVGEESQAEKIIEGKSRAIDVNNADWRGETTVLPMFRAEKCKIQLSVANDSLQFYDSLVILNTRIIEGNLVTDFEDGFNGKWLSFVQSGADMSFIIKEDSNAAQGKHYYDMGGKVDWDWLIGMIEFPADAMPDGTFNLTDNADNLYFNTMLYLPEGIVNPLILFQFREDENDDGNFDEASEDMYAVEVKAAALQTGWNLFSIKYSDLASLNNGSPVDPNGNGVFEPNKLYRISVLYLANPSSGYAQTYMDYVIFTDKSPLQP
ncbi:hypothetical protein GC194_03170 [bacterium]|nr:hypothetical protein [bacterium]